MVLASPETSPYDYYYGESYPQHPASDYNAGLGANVEPAYDLYEELVDDAEEAKNNLAVEQGPGKRGSRGLLLKKLFKLIFIG